jgi:dTDP-4-dehydrorhamnose 3,5-epimerase
MSSKIILNPLKVIDTKGGNVMHAMKNTDLGYKGFGEAYFSEIEYKSVKAWKRHKEMTLNLIVPVGKVRFILFDDRENLKGIFKEFIIGHDSYSRLTVPPLVWFGFQGLKKNISTVLNIANITHDPNEVDRKNIDEIEFNWSI